MPAPSRPQPVDHLPLPPVAFQILVLLSGGEKHGWRLLQEAEAIGRPAPRIATLYRTLQRLERSALIEHRPELEDDEDRRRVYGLTPLGRAVAAAEARRLNALLSVARAAELLDEADAG